MVSPQVLICGSCSIVHSLVPLIQASGFKLKAFWDACPGFRQTASQLGIQVTDENLEKLLADAEIGLVFICIQPFLQLSVIERCLKAGKTVVCALPAVPVILRVGQLSPASGSTAGPASGSLFYAQVLRYLSTVQHVKKLLDQNKIGRLQVIEMRLTCGSLTSATYDWTCDYQMGGGLLNFHGAALLDLVWFWTSRQLDRIDSRLSTYTRTTGRIKGIRHITADDYCIIQGELEEKQVDPTQAGGSCPTVAEEKTSLLIAMNSHGSAGQFDLEVTLMGSGGRLLLAKSGTELHFMPHQDLSETSTDGDRERKTLLHHDSFPLSSDTVLVEGCPSGTAGGIPAPLVRGWQGLLSSLWEWLSAVEPSPETRRMMGKCARPSDWVHLEGNLVRCARASKRCPVLQGKRTPPNLRGQS